MPNLFFELWKFLIKEIETEQANCLRKYKDINCQNCINVCKAEAISLTDNGIVLNKEKCTYCGICMTYCSNKVINFNFKPFGIFKENSFIYLCQHSLGSEYSSCLGSLDLRTILLTLSNNHVYRLILSPGDCENCIPGVNTELKKQVEICQNILQHFYTDKKVFLESFFIKSFNRAEVINFYKNKVLENLKTEFVLPFLERINHQKNRALISAFKSLGEIKNEYIKESILPWYELKIDTDRCNFCGVCYSLCPFGSIFYIEENNTAYIFQRPADCTKCGLCLKVCPEGIIKYLPKNNLRTFIGKKDILLISKEFKNCISCSRLILDNTVEVKCINCRKIESIGRDIKEIVKTLK